MNTKIAATLLALVAPSNPSAHSAIRQAASKRIDNGSESRQ